MSEQDRFQRPEPERTRPTRDWTGAFRPGEPDGRQRPDGPDPSAGAGEAVEGWTRTVGHAVSLGYEVIEDQIRQGQRIAEQVGGRQYGSADAAGEVQETTARFLRYSSEFAALWFDAWGRAASQGLRGWAPPGPDNGNGRHRRGPSGPTPPPPPFRPRGSAPVTSPVRDGAAASVEVALEVESRRPARVSVSLPATADPGTLDVVGLGEGPQLVDVAFRRAGEGHAVAVRVRVPDDLPAGEHSWQVVERETRRTVGHLTVAIGEAGAPADEPRAADRR